MKKNIKRTVGFLTSVALTVSMSFDIFSKGALSGGIIFVSAEDIIGGDYYGITYNIIDGEASITNYYCDDIVLKIPSEIEGCPVTAIGCAVFSHVGMFNSVTIPDTVTSIGEYAFHHCLYLSEINIPDGVTSIEDGVFQTCVKLTSMDIPDSVTSIGKYAFAECEGLTGIDIPNGVTSIGLAAFAECCALTSIDIPDGVKSIEDYTFENCKSLASVEIPDSVTSIGQYAFVNCTSLTSIKIPEAVTSIEANAFSYCINLDTIYGYKNSYAEDYANKIRCTFIPLNSKGDMNGNKKIDLSDLAILKQHILQDKSQSKTDIILADINADGNVNVFDYVRLMQMILDN